MKRLAIIVIGTLLSGIMAMLVAPELPALAQGSPAILRIDPPALGLRPGAQGKINIVVENVQNLYGLQLQLVFDPGILQAVDASPDKEGIQIQPADWWKDGYVAVNQVDASLGQINFAATLLRPAGPVSGNRVIATVTFTTRKEGSSPIRIEAAILSTRDAEVIPFTKQDGKIEVNSNGKAPEMPANVTSSRPAFSQLLLAGAAILAFLAALGVFVYAVRHRK